jgi:adenylate kinase
MSTANTVDRAAWLVGPGATCSAIPAASNAWRLVLLGAPGVGKGTQAELLKQHLGACHLSTGDVFRAAAKRSDCDLSPAMRLALDCMRRGELVPDNTVWEMVRERKDCLLHCGGFILDGFPRTLGQAESLKELMETEKLGISAVVNYELPMEEIVLRLSGRRMCKTCKSVFHITQRRPRIATRCDHCGGRLVQREDDRPEAITVRLQAYERSTAPLIKFYKERGLLLPIAAKGTPGEIFARTMNELHALPVDSRRAS